MLRAILCDWLGWHAWNVANNTEWDGKGKPPMYCPRCNRYREGG